MIEIKDLCKRFEDKILFQNYNLEIADGSFVVFSGKSGCGKTTLLNMIGGIESPDSGKIMVNGVDVSQKKNKKRYFRDTVGFLFQNFALLEQKTVLENLNIIQKSGRTEITIEEALKRVGLSEVMNKKVYKLSGGEQQRLALARLMIKKCSLILADEPTGSLDEYNSGVVMEILHELHRMGKTVIIVTHSKKIIEQEEYVIEWSEDLAKGWCEHE